MSLGGSDGVSRHQETSEEIHLSHNQIGHRGMAQLLTALARHPREAYPRSVEHLDEAGRDRRLHVCTSPFAL